MEPALLIDDPRPGVRYACAAAVVAVGALRGTVPTNGDEAVVVGVATMVGVLVAVLEPPRTILGATLRWATFALVMCPVLLGFVGMAFAVAVAPLVYGPALWVGVGHALDGRR